MRATLVLPVWEGGSNGVGAAKLRGSECRGKSGWLLCGSSVSPEPDAARNGPKG